MKKILLLQLFLCLFVIGIHAQEGALAKDINFTTFTKDKQNVTRELDSLTQFEFKSHPEYGVLPHNAPCTDCIELLQKRDETHRYFVKKGTKGKEFYSQSAYNVLNYKDENGLYRAIDSRLKPTETPGVYSARQQAAPTTINTLDKYTSILNDGKEFQFNRNVNIYNMHADGSMTSLGQPDWSNYTAGDDGIIVHNFYPGIDLIIKTGPSYIESFYRLNKPIHLNDGWLVVRDNMKVPEGLVYDFTYAQKREDSSYLGTMFINDAKGRPYYYIGTPAAFDENNTTDNAIDLNYRIDDKGVFDLYVPVAWMNDPKRSYPLLIDPFVSAKSVLSAVTITGSGYNSTCFQNGCGYNLKVVVPQAAVITDITATFWFRALGSCFISQGAWDLKYNGCRFPAQANKFNTCSLPLPGLCQLTLLSCYGDMLSCLPPPKCTVDTLPFTLTFYRCVQPGAGCGFSCISVDPDSTWSMIVTGRTVEVTTQPVSVCENSNVDLSANATWGVPPYTYTWYPGKIVGNPVSVSPKTTTTYTVTVSTCGGIDSAQATSIVTVFPESNPGFTVVPNPACQNDPVTITGLGNASQSSYDWKLPGSNLGTQDDQQNPNGVIYSSGGTYDIILNFTDNNGCLFPDTQQITVIPTVIPTVTISGSPNPICPGMNVTFTTTALSGGGTNPTYQWYLNGNQVNGETKNTFSSTTLNDGDKIELHIKSNDPCPRPDSAVSNVITMVVVLHVAPVVTIVASPTLIICPGENIQFDTISVVNGGSNPGYQWYINGVLQPGQTNPSFSSNALKDGDVITLHLLHSNVNCVLPDSAISNDLIVVYKPNIPPSVSIIAAPSDTICPGDKVTCTATPMNGGPNPSYQWYKNGVAVGTDSVNWTSFTLQGGDVITVHLRNAIGPCIFPDSAVSNIITMVPSPLKAPTVTITVAPSDSICPNDLVTFSSTTTNAGSSPIYQWYLNGNPVGNGLDTYSSSSLVGGDVITLQITNATGPCIFPDNALSNAIIMIAKPLVAPTITITVAPTDTICPGEYVGFTATTTNEGSNPTYQWYLNGNPVGSGGTSYSSTSFNNGDVISVQLSNATGPCIFPNTAVSNNITIVYKPPVIPTISIVADPPGIICQGQTVTFTATQTGGGPGPSYQWFVNATPSGSNSDVFSSSNLQNGDVISVILTSNDPCANPTTASSNQIVIQMFPPMTVDATGDATICPGESVPIISVAAGGEGAPYFYSWDNGAVDSATVVTPSTTTIYTVSATDGCGSTPAKDIVTVIVSPIPVPDFSFNPSEPTEYTRTVTFHDKSTGAVTWSWDFGEKTLDDTSNLQNPTYSYSGVGVYTVRLIVTNSAGCKDSISYRLEVTEEYAYYIPNSFTPNGDGINDYFSPLGTHDLIYTMTIYNRWGEKIFETDETSFPWNGQVDGSDKVAESGVYIYRVRFRDERYTSDALIGSVTLVR